MSEFVPSNPCFFNIVWAADFFNLAILAQVWLIYTFLLNLVLYVLLTMKKKKRIFFLVFCTPYK